MTQALSGSNPSNLLFKLTEFDMESDQYGNSSRTLKMVLFFPPTKIKIVEEYYTTEIGGVMGNVSGILGALLGASALSLLDMALEFMFARSKNFMNWR